LHLRLKEIRLVYSFVNHSCSRKIAACSRSKIIGILMRFLVFLIIVVLAPPLAAQTISAPVPAQALFNQGRFQDAAAAYRSLMEKDPSSAEAHVGLVRSLLKLDDVPEAETESQNTLEILPQSVLAHAVRGDVYFRRGLMDLAEHEYKSALQTDPKCSRAALGLGRVYSAESNRAKAGELIAQAHALDPDDGDALYYWAITLPYPRNAEALAKHLAEFRDAPEKERREREYLEFVKALAGRRIWIPVRDAERLEIKLETLLAPAPRGSATEKQPPLSNGPAMVAKGVGLRVKLNDNAVSTFLLDTGASGLTIKKKLAQKIGARRLSDQSLEGVGSSGPASAYNAWVDKVTIGDLEFRDCVVKVSLKNDVSDEDGLIGADIFDQHLVTIDFPGHKLLPSIVNWLMLTPEVSVTSTWAAIGFPVARLVVFCTIPPAGETITAASNVPFRIPLTVNGLLITTCSG